MPILHSSNIHIVCGIQNYDMYFIDKLNFVGFVVVFIYHIVLCMYIGNWWILKRYWTTSKKRNGKVENSNAITLLWLDVIAEIL